MVPTRDQPQDKRPTQAESEGLETGNLLSKRIGKKIRGTNTHIRQNIFQKRSIKRVPEGHFIILKGRIHQEDINIVNIYAPKYKSTKIHKENLGGFQERY